MKMTRSLTVKIFPTRQKMGRAAAEAVRGTMLSLLQEQKSLRMVFASAPSQVEFLASLRSFPDIPWQRVTGFHMDEYPHVGKGSPQSFSQFLRDHLFDHLPFGAVECLNSDCADPEEECMRYAALLEQAPVDIVCMGIGENGHIAFNDPPVADFHDPLSVKMVRLDEPCRKQQVNDGAFPTLDDVPREAISLTVPTLLSAPKIFAVVPGPRKARSVFDALQGPVSTACPASVLRTHPSVEIYLDTDSAVLLD